MSLFAIVLAVFAFGLAVFAFVDRKDLEQRLKVVEQMIDNKDAAYLDMIRTAVRDVRVYFSGRVQALETRATALEKKTEAKVQGAVTKAKTAVKGAVASAKKRL